MYGMVGVVVTLGLFLKRKPFSGFFIAKKEKERDGDFNSF
jgi:hypothetical protein